MVECFSSQQRKALDQLLNEVKEDGQKEKESQKLELQTLS
jgi:hypothetical protein